VSRIRTIKPEILEDEKTAALSNGAWRLFASAIVLADDHGYLRGSPQWLHSQAFWGVPGETVAKVKSYLDELTRARLLIAYTVRAQAYLAIRTWTRHQRISNAGKPHCPGPEGSDPPTSDDSPRVAANCGETPLDLRPPTTDPDHRPRPRPPLAPSSSSSPPASAPRTTALVPVSPTVITLPLIDGTEHPVTEADVSEWSTAYPGVDVLQELRKLRQWNLSRPRCRKTPRGIRAHITSWLGREQDKNGARAEPRAPPQPHMNAKTNTLRAALEAPDDMFTPRVFDADSK